MNRCGGFYFQEADVTLKRACSLLTVKSFSEDERVITGIASTPSPDRDGDIPEPEGGVWQYDPVSLAA